MKAIKGFLQKDYFNYNQNKIFKLRDKILRTNNKFIKVLLLKRYNKLCHKNNSFIPLSAKIGKTIFPHGLSGIFISSFAVIEDNCVIFQNVTIGSNTLKDSKNNGSPKIGKNCYIGAGAKIIGNVEIGDNVRIGANCVVTKNIPDNSTVVIDNIRIIKHKEKKDNSFISINNLRKEG